MTNKRELHFLMLGGKDYVNKVMQEESTRENVLRNIKGAPTVNGEISIVVSDKASKTALKKNLAKYGLSKEEINSVKVTNDLILMKRLKEGDTQDRENYEAFKNARNSGDDLRFGAYSDNIKLLSIYNAPKDVTVEVIDLDQQFDIKKNPSLENDRKEALYSSMHIGQYSGDPSFSRHDMNKEELIEYCQKNGHDINHLAYSNERSYLMGSGKDERLPKIAIFSRQMPHFFVLAKALTDQDFAIPHKNTRDNTMPKNVREEMITRFHLPFSQTGLLEKEKARGLDVPFKKLSKSAGKRSLESQSNILNEEKSVSSPSVTTEDVSIQFDESANQGTTIQEVLVQATNTENNVGWESLGGGNQAAENSGIISSSDAIHEGKSSDSNNPNPSVGQVAFVGTLVAAVAAFIGNKINAGQNSKNDSHASKASGRKSKKGGKSR